MMPTTLLLLSDSGQSCGPRMRGLPERQRGARRFIWWRRRTDDPPRRASDGGAPRRWSQAPFSPFHGAGHGKRGILVERHKRLVAANKLALALGQSRELLAQIEAGEDPPAAGARWP